METHNGYGYKKYKAYQLPPDDLLAGSNSAFGVSLCLVGGQGDAGRTRLGISTSCCGTAPRGKTSRFPVIRPAVGLRGVQARGASGMPRTADWGHLGRDRSTVGGVNFVQQGTLNSVLLSSPERTGLCAGPSGTRSPGLTRAGERRSGGTVQVHSVLKSDLVRAGSRRASEPTPLGHSGAPST